MELLITCLLLKCLACPLVLVHFSQMSFRNFIPLLKTFSGDPNAPAPLPWPPRPGLCTESHDMLMRYASRESGLIFVSGGLAVISMAMDAYLQNLKTKEKLHLPRFHDIVWDNENVSSVCSALPSPRTSCNAVCLFQRILCTLRPYRV